MMSRSRSRFSALALLALAATALLAPTRAARAQTPFFSKLAVNRCMDVSGGRRDPGTPLIIWECNNGENQRFTLTSSGEIRVLGLCVDALGGQGRDGDAIGLWPCHGGANQRWRWTGSEFRSYNDKCIDVKGGSANAGTPLVLWPCSYSLNQRWTQGAAASAVASGAPVKKLYVIDGTNSYEIHHNAMFHFYEMWNAGAKVWQNGVNQMATNVGPAYDQMYNTICQDVRPAARGGAGVTQVFLAGYSRGAIMAIRLANETRAQCGANVVFLGLVDAVNTSIDTWEVRVNPPLTGGSTPRAVHIRKPRPWEHVLTTVDIANAFRINHPQNVDHQEIVCNKNGNDQGWKWTRDQLVYYASQAGGTFAPDARSRTDC